jgi:hypothetical protein
VPHHCSLLQWSVPLNAWSLFSAPVSVAWNVWSLFSEPIISPSECLITVLCSSTILQMNSW